MNKPVCLVTAPVATRSGYGAHSRDIVRALIKLDRYDVKIWNVKWGSTPMNALQKGDPNDDIIIERLLTEPSLPTQPEIHIHIVVPNEFQTYGKYNIGITAIDETIDKWPFFLFLKKSSTVLIQFTTPKKFILNVFFI